MIVGKAHDDAEKRGFARERRVDVDHVAVANGGDMVVPEDADLRNLVVVDERLDGA